jgi:hypothetical protein
LISLLSFFESRLKKVAERCSKLLHYCPTGKNSWPSRKMIMMIMANLISKDKSDISFSSFLFYLGLQTRKLYTLPLTSDPSSNTQFPVRICTV